MIASWILNSVEPNLTTSIIYGSSVFEIYSDLKERFWKNNALRIFQIQRKIAANHQGTMSVAAHNNKLKTPWDELAYFNDPPICFCGAAKKLEDPDQREKEM